MNLPRAYEQEMKELLGTELEAYKKSFDLPGHAGTACQYIKDHLQRI